MDPNTGHLIDTSEYTKKKLEELYEKGYESVPDHLNTQAKLELMGKKETYVGKHCTGNLSKHMRYLKKKRDKLAKKERRKNRSHCE